MNYQTNPVENNTKLQRNKQQDKNFSKILKII